MASIPGPPILYKSNPSQIHPNCTNEAIQFFWSPPDTDGGSAILSYTLECSSIPFTQTYSASTFYTNVTGLTNGIEYTFTIKATNAIGDGPVATYRTVQTGFKPGPPRNSGIFQATSTTLTAIWDPPSSDGGALIKWYTLRAFSTTPGYSNVIACAYGTQDNTTLVGLNSNSTYNIFLDAVNDAGHSRLIQLNTIPIKVVIGGGGTTFGTIPANKLIYSTNGGVSFQQSANGGTIFTDTSTLVQTGAWNGSVFAYIGFRSNFGFDIAYSSDGITWSKSSFDNTSIADFVTSGFNIGDSQILVKNNIFYLYLSYATNPGSGNVYHRTLYTSSDGNTWTLTGNVTGLNTFETIFISSMLIKSNGTVLAIACRIDGGEMQALYSSSNDLAFTAVSSTGLQSSGRTFGTSDTYWTIIYDGTYYYTVTSFYSFGVFQMYRSSDGLSWTSHGTAIPIGLSIQAIASDGAGNLVVGGRSNNTLDSCFYSNDGGDTWNGTGLGILDGPNYVSQNFYQISWTGQKFVMCSYYAFNTFGGRVLYSGDGGATWTIIYTTGECSQPFPTIATALPATNRTLVSFLASTYSGSGIWNDDSGNGYNASIETGTAAKNLDGNGIVLDGSTNWIFSNFGSQRYWSIVTWFKRTDISDSAACIVTEKYTGGNINMVIFSALNEIANTEFAGGFYVGTWRNGTGITFPLNEWHQLTVTWDGTNIKTYLDGSINSTVSQAGNISSSTSLNSYSIGRRFDGGSDYVTGEIGALQIYGYPLTSTQITNYYIATSSTYI